jgi:rhodanese-related sulfurtransferase
MLNFLKKLLGLDTPALTPDILKSATIIDVRTPAEFKSGKVKGSRNLPLANFSTQLATLKSEGKPVVVCCKSGTRSAMALRQLRSAGIEGYNGGSWQRVKGML